MVGSITNKSFSAVGTAPVHISMSKALLLCHIVFGTKYRKRTIPYASKEDLYRYICGVARNLHCKIICINGIEDHIHILMEITPTLSVADIIKKIKQSSSHWLKNNKNFADFEGWGKGYFAVSVSPDKMNSCIEYIQGQELHHKTKNYTDELYKFIDGCGLEWFEDEWQ